MKTGLTRRASFTALIAVSGYAVSLSPVSSAETAISDNGIVRVKSAYSAHETIGRLKADIAAKGIKFFGTVDQAQLAADAGFVLLPSTLLIFGNPPLGTQFITANPSAGLDWPVRLLVHEARSRRGPLRDFGPILGSPDGGIAAIAGCYRSMSQSLFQSIATVWQTFSIGHSKHRPGRA